MSFFYSLLKNGSFFIFLIIFLACGADKRKNDRDRFFLLGNEALKKNEYKEAVRLYTEAINLDSDYADAYNNRGIAHLKRGDAGTALLDFNQALLIRSDPSFQWNRSEAYAALNRYDKALADIAEVKNAFPDSANVYFSEGLIHFQFQNYAEAETAFNQTLLHDSTNGEVFINRGTVRFYLNRLGDAEADLRKGLALMPAEAHAWNTLALVETEKGNTDQALENIEEALKLSPNEAYFLNNKGYILLQKGRLEEASKAIDMSILINPQNAWAYRNKGLFLYKSERYDDAVRLLEKAAGMDGKVEGVYLWLGKAYLGLNDTRNACEAFARATPNAELQTLLDENCR